MARLVWAPNGATHHLTGDGFTASITYVTANDRGAGVEWDVRRHGRAGRAVEWARGHASSGAAAKVDVATWLERRGLVELPA